MREITIDFTKTPIEISNHVLGKRNEHNATQLIITPPTEMSAPDSGIVNYCVAFQVGAHRKSYSALFKKAAKITVPLESAVTQVNVLSLQLEGYDETENLIMKSDMVDNLIFDPSVDGEHYEGSCETNLGAQVASLKSQIKDLNDDISEINRPTNSIIFPLGNIDVDPPNFYVTYLNQGVWGLVDGSETFAEGIEIKTIEFLYLDNWIDIRDMIKLDYVPYTLNMYKTFFYSGEMILAVISCSSDNTIINALNDFAIPSIRVTYYIP